jgi:hypothetical protein
MCVKESLWLLRGIRLWGIEMREMALSGTRVIQTVAKTRMKVLRHG